MNPFNNDAIVYFGGTTLCTLGIDEVYRMNSPVEVKSRYINGLSQTVHAVWRSGLKTGFPATSVQSSHYNNTFTIRTTYTFEHTVTRSTAHSLSYIPLDENYTAPILYAIKKSFDAQVKVNSCNGATIVLDTSFTYNDFVARGGSIYIDDLDIVISINEFEHVPYHPESKMGREKKHVDKVNEKKSANRSFTYNVEIVDNTGVFGNRFKKIGEFVFKIVPIEDRTRLDGIYIISDRPSDTAYSLSGVISTYYTFEEAEEKVGLYRNHEDAKYSGDVTGARKKLIQDMEYENTKRKMEHESKKDEREYHRTKDKIELEQRTTARKEAMEILKWVGALFGIAVSAYIGIEKLKAKTGK